MVKITIDPWGSFLVKDYEKLIGHYGLEPFTEKLLAKVPGPNKLMRRRIVFAHTDLERVVDAMNKKVTQIEEDVRRKIFFYTNFTIICICCTGSEI